VYVRVCVHVPVVPLGHETLRDSSDGRDGHVVVPEVTATAVLVLQL
jgi:hypothetical protein